MPKKLKISGPGAADFLTAPGGTDFPETDASKGATQATRGEGLLDNAEDLEPDLDAVVHGDHHEAVGAHGHTGRQVERKPLRSLIRQDTQRRGDVARKLTKIDTLG